MQIHRPHGPELSGVGGSGPPAGSRAGSGACSSVSPQRWSRWLGVKGEILCRLSNFFFICSLLSLPFLPQLQQKHSVRKGCLPLWGTLTLKSCRGPSAAHFPQAGAGSRSREFLPGGCCIFSAHWRLCCFHLVFLITLNTPHRTNPKLGKHKDWNSIILTTQRQPLLNHSPAPVLLYINGLVLYMLSTALLLIFWASFHVDTFPGCFSCL